MLHHRLFHQCRQALFAAGVDIIIQAIDLECRRYRFKIGTGFLHPGIVGPIEYIRRDYADQQPQDDQNHQDFDKAESCL